MTEETLEIAVGYGYTEKRSSFEEKVEKRAFDIGNFIEKITSYPVYVFETTEVDPSSIIINILIHDEKYEEKAKELPKDISVAIDERVKILKKKIIIEKKVVWEYL